MILGQRLCELCGKAPALEEEMALMNVALDLVGQARNWYEYAAELIDDGRDADKLCFRRDAHDYRNLLLTEQPNEDYAVTMGRQFFFDVYHYFTLKSLTESSDERIAGIAARPSGPLPRIRFSSSVSAWSSRWCADRSQSPSRIRPRSAA